MSRKVEIVARETLYQGYARVDRYWLRHETFAGGMSAPITREVFERGHAAAALPYDPDRDVVVLLEQFRIGAYVADIEPWQIEIVAGIIDPGETPDEVARREMVEEAGIEARELEFISRVALSPGAVSETMYFYCARVEAPETGGIYGLDHEGEDIRTFTLPAADAIDLVTQGRIVNGAAVIALQWFALNRERLRREWTS